MANIIRYFFSLSHMSMHDMPFYLKEKKNMQRTWKAKRIKMLLNMVASMFLGDVGVIWCTSKVMAPHQTVMIVYGYSWFSYIIIFTWWDTYAFLQKLIDLSGVLSHLQLEVPNKKDQLLMLRYSRLIFWKWTMLRQT